MLLQCSESNSFFPFPVLAIQGVKVCLAPGAASSASSMDYTLLHLTWTAEKLEQQLDLIDQRYQK